MPSFDTPEQIFESLGRCIFCFSTEELTTEHIIPRSLSCTGEVYIKKGSCKSCNSSANVRFEAKALSADFKTARILLGMKRRNRGRRNAPLKLPLVADGNALHAPEEEFDMELEPGQYPNLMTLLYFYPAGLLIGVDRGASLSLVRTVICNLGPQPRQITGRTLTIMGDLDHTSFALTIAKIGYTFAAAQLGIEGFAGDAIRDLLRGNRDDVYNFVGGIWKGEFLTTPHLHMLHIRHRGTATTVLVHLFASVGMYPYEVVVDPGT